MDTGLMLAIIGLVVAGLSSVLGIWMERDPSRPPRWAILLTALIVMATIVSLFQSTQDAQESAAMEEDMARMLQSLDRLSQGSPEVGQFLAKEMEAQKRANPDVIQKVAARVTAEGGDASAMLAKHLPASEMGGVKGVQPTVSPAKTNTADVKKLESELATVKKQLADAQAFQRELETTKEEKAKSDAKVKELTEQVEKLETDNQKLKAAPKPTGTRWEKG
jgi:hypothetical protein